jgi:hypothetical protein
MELNGVRNRPVEIQEQIAYVEDTHKIRELEEKLRISYIEIDSVKSHAAEL